MSWALVAILGAMVVALGGIVGILIFDGRHRAQCYDQTMRRLVEKNEELRRKLDEKRRNET